MPVRKPTAWLCPELWVEAVPLLQPQAKRVKEKVKTRVNPRNTFCADTTSRANALKEANAIILIPPLPIMPLPWLPLKVKRAAAKARARAKEKGTRSQHGG